MYKVIYRQAVQAKKIACFSILPAKMPGDLRLILAKKVKRQAIKSLFLKFFLKIKVQKFCLYCLPSWNLLYI